MLRTAIFLFTLSVSGTSQTPDDIVPAWDTNTCFPEIIIYSSSDPVRICLNRFDSRPDSCIEVIVGGDILADISLRFTRTNTTGWHYAGIIRPDSAVPTANLRMEIRTNHRGDLQQALFYTKRQDMLQKRVPGIQTSNDRPIQPADTLSIANLHFQRTVRSCRPPKNPAIVVYRTYAYPPNYRRDPIYNHPELSMFHYGKSVRMPTTHSLENRAQRYIYWHCNVLAPLQFDNPEELEKKEALKNRFKKAHPPKPVTKKKMSFLRLRPLR